MGSNPSQFAACGDDCPVENVGWNDVQEYVRQLSQKTGKTYRLPSEAEWEYACRAGARQQYCGGDSADDVAWHGGSDALGLYRKTHPVAQKQANVWGLYDMSGNVLEWVEDCYRDGYSKAPSDGSAWKARQCEARVLRGGSWNYNPRSARSASRVKLEPAGQFSNSGFRLARTLP